MGGIFREICRFEPLIRLPIGSRASVGYLDTVTSVPYPPSRGSEWVAGLLATAHKAAIVGGIFREICRFEPPDPPAHWLPSFGRLLGYCYLGTLPPFTRFRMGCRTPGYRAQGRHCGRHLPGDQPFQGPLIRLPIGSRASVGYLHTVTSVPYPPSRGSEWVAGLLATAHKAAIVGGIFREVSRSEAPLTRLPISSRASVGYGDSVASGPYPLREVRNGLLDSWPPRTRPPSFAAASGRSDVPRPADPAAN